MQQWALKRSPLPQSMVRLNCFLGNVNLKWICNFKGLLLQYSSLHHAQLNNLGSDQEKEIIFGCMVFIQHVPVHWQLLFVSPTLSRWLCVLQERQWLAVIGVTGATTMPVSLPAVPPRSLNY